MKQETQTPDSKEGLHTQPDIIEKAWRDAFDSGIACCGIATGTKEDTLFEKWMDKNKKAVNERKALLDALKACYNCLTMDSDMEEDFAPEIKQVKKLLDKAGW